MSPDSARTTNDVQDVRRRTATLRRSRRLFLLGPAIAFVALQLLVYWMHHLDASGEIGDRVALRAALAIVVITGWTFVSFWWAPTARCPRCRRRLAGTATSPYGWLWPWMARPRCLECRFDPFGPDASRD